MSSTGDPGQGTRGGPTRGGFATGPTVEANASPWRPRLCKTRRGVLYCGVHVIVVGCGRVGSGLAMLAQRRGPFGGRRGQVARAFRRLKGWDGPCIVGSGFDRDDLEKAGAVHADALAAVTSGDNTNILTVRIARETYKIPNVVARIYRPSACRHLHAPRYPHRGDRHCGPSTRSGGAYCRTWTSVTGPIPRDASP